MQNETSKGRSPSRNRDVNESRRWRFRFGSDVPSHSGRPTIALYDPHWKPAGETSCCICLRRCICLIRQCPCVRFRLSTHNQIHNLTGSKIDAFLLKIATVIPLQLCTVSGFRSDSSFPIALDFGDSSFEFKTKISSNFKCFFFDVCYCESSSTFYFPGDSSFRIAIF